MHRIDHRTSMNVATAMGERASRPEVTNFRRLILSVVVAAIWMLAQGVNAQVRDHHQEVDRLFAQYERAGSPGCALAIIEDGKIIYKRGYGLANIEYAVPIKTDTIFHVASVSKQFTAFAVHLLVADGKLSLDDDVRKYLPELHDFGKTITIRHLLHHTSGLRDQWSLLNMAGWRSGDIITEDDILNLVWRQKELNFAPGDEELYSNTGYTLLGLIVKRVSGKSLRQFCQERIFQPLGMSRTHFHDDNTEIVAGRAYSYGPAGSGGFVNIPLQYANVGATSLFTTVEDMFKWDQNFYTPRAGSPAVIAAMLEKGKLNNGKEIAYASGLFIGDYRGLRTVEHSGSDAGYRSDILRFPDQRFSIILFSNLSSVDPTSYARQIADIYLAEAMKPLPKSDSTSAKESKPNEIKVDTRLLDRYRGDYLLGSDILFTFTREGDRLVLEATGRGKMGIFASSPTDFFFKGIGARLRFVADKDGKVDRVMLDDGGDWIPVPRIVRFLPKPDQLTEYEGKYYSDELGVIYDVFQKDGKLRLRYPRGEVALEPTTLDTFVAGYPVGRVAFSRDLSNKTIRTFKLDDGRVRNLAFVRAQDTIQPTSTATLANTALSGTFHLSQREPVKRLALRGKTGMIKINNIGPAGLVVKNSQNNVTLGAHTRMDLVFEGDTVLSLSSPDSSHQTEGTFEVNSR